MSRVVHLEVTLEDDGQLDLIKLFSDSRLSPEEWSNVWAQLKERLPEQFEYTADIERSFR